MKNSAEKPRRRLKKGAVNALQNLAIVLLLIVGIGLSAAGGLLTPSRYGSATGRRPRRPTTAMPRRHRRTA